MVGAEKKVERMSWCMSEAHLDAHRAAALMSKVTALYQDASGKRMASRFSVVAASGVARKGLLRILHHSQGGSEGVAASTRKALEAFCTPRLDHAHFGNPTFNSIGKGGE